MKQLFMLLFSSLVLPCLSQLKSNEEKSIGKTAAELILTDYRIDVNCNQEILSKIPNAAIDTEFDFIYYFRTNEDVLLKEDTATNLAISKKEVLLAENYLLRTNIVIISVRKCAFKEGDFLIENSYCLTVKEEKRFFFEDNLNSIHTIYHYYWYSGFFKNYLSHYSRSILHSPEGLVINYSESINKNPLPYLEQNFSNKELQTMTIYPNPASQYINIQYIGHDGEENTFELMDAIGKPVKKFRTTSFSGLNTFKVEVSALPKGFYTLKGTINEQIHSAKLILQ